MTTNTPTRVEKATVKPATPWEGSFGFPLFHRLSHELDAMFERFGMERPVFEELPRMWTPDVEVSTRNNELLVKVDVPGMKKEEMTIEVIENALVVRGERKQEKEEKKEGFFRTERTYGSFYRTLPLPEGVNPELAKATMHDGVLEVRMPMAKVEEKVRKLEITTPEPVVSGKAA
jgi:HSP20 family protein